MGRSRDLASRTFEDLGDQILMPGLINAHCHLDFTVMRGAILQQESFSHWVRRINDLKRTLTDEDYLLSISNGFAELRRWGTTTVFNIESFPELMVQVPPPRFAPGGSMNLSTSEIASTPRTSWREH